MHEVEISARRATAGARYGGLYSGFRFACTGRDFPPGAPRRARATEDYIPDSACMHGVEISARRATAGARYEGIPDSALHARGRDFRPARHGGRALRRIIPDFALHARGRDFRPACHGGRALRRYSGFRFACTDRDFHPARHGGRATEDYIPDSALHARGRDFRPARHGGRATEDYIPDSALHARGRDFRPARHGGRALRRIIPDSALHARVEISTRRATAGARYGGLFRISLCMQGGRDFRPACHGERALRSFPIRILDCSS